MKSPEQAPQGGPLDRARKLAKEGKLRAATDLLIRTLSRRKPPDNALACARDLGFFLLQNGKEGQFLEWIQNKGEVWKEDPFLLLLEGKAFYRMEMWDRADKAYRQVLKAHSAPERWKEQARADLKSLAGSRELIEKGKAALGRARLLIAGGGMGLLLGVGVLLVILKRMEQTSSMEGTPGEEKT